jgi:hypothetical protein
MILGAVPAARSRSPARAWRVTDTGDGAVVTTFFERDPVRVPFSGDRAVTAPMTYGQINILEWLGLGAKHFTVMELPLDLPAGTTVEDVASSVSVLLARHEGLRTLYAEGGHLTQRVLDHGELLLRLYEVAPATAVTRADLFAGLARRVRERPLDVATSLPVRLALAVDAGTVLAGILACSHLAVDAGALAVLARELDTLFRDPAARRVGPARHQPVDRAAAEAHERRRRRAEAALEYQAVRLATMPPHVFVPPGTGGSGTGGSGGSGPAELELRSRAAATGLLHLARRTRTSRSAAVLAAVCAALATVTGRDRCEFPTMAGNRGEPQLAEYVGTLAQAVLLSVDTRGAGFDTLVRRAYAAMLTANRHGVYDAYRSGEQRRGIEERRGVRFLVEPLNCLAPDHARLDRAPRPLAGVLARHPSPVLRWRSLDPVPYLVSFVTSRLDGELVLKLWVGDTGLVPEPLGESLLLAVHRLLLAAAGGDLSPEEVVAALDLEPYEYGPDSLVVDGCRVDLAQVRALVADAASPAASAVVPEPAGDIAPGGDTAPDGVRLVAYLGPGGPATPEEAHARCLARLGAYRFAMTPHRYVICAAAPAAPAAPGARAAWERQPVLESGTGRPSQA